MRRLLAVLGRDVSRSLSPILHEAAAWALDIDVAYVPVSCRDEAHFDEAIRSLAVLGALGANVTIPYKARALALAAEISPTARAIDAVNTLTFGADGSIRGDNTDGPGLLAVLEGLPPECLARAQVLGAGGAARAAVWALAAAQADELVVSARRGAEACAEVGRDQRQASPGRAPEARPLAPVAGATLVISSLPNDEALAQQALDEWIDPSLSPFILDLAYGGVVPSPLTRLARARGLRADDGLGMLVEQAARAFALWTGGELSRILAAMRKSSPARVG